MSNTTLKLEKLTCPSCMQKIIDTVNNLEGIEQMKILFNSSKARVIYDERMISEATIVNTIVEAGYGAKKVEN